MESTYGEGRVCIVTGAGRGIGRAHALELAAHGFAVVVNDLAVDGGSTEPDPATQVVEQITRDGGKAVVSHHDVADWTESRDLIELAKSEFGRLDVVVNNAGILRDRMLVNMEEAEWDAVLTVHAKGTFMMSRWAARHWRELHREGQPVDARIINTTSATGLYGNPGQANYAAAKAGIAALTIVSAQELQRYGVTVNAIAPAALTRMSEHLEMTAAMDPEQLKPEWAAPLVAWLASTHSADVTGRVLEVSGQRIAVAHGWSTGPTAPPVSDVMKVEAVVRDLLDRALPNADITGAVGAPPVAAAQASGQQ